jgi:putative nucleotidyltransferase with HDIG domain
MLHFQIGNHHCEEVAAHCRRVATLARRVSSGLPSATPESDVLAACIAFDDAVEFAAYERVPIPDAIAAFHTETGPAFGSAVHKALMGATSVEPKPWAPLRLPVMPKAAFQLMRTSDDTTSPAQLQLIAGSDPVLCAALLNAANSARFGLREPVSRVIDAAARLGIPVARKVLMASCFAPLFASKPLQDLWKHSQSVAAAAAEAARTISFDPEIAWTAGLLHDIGRLIFKTGATESRIRLMQWVESGFPLIYAEILTYGKDHARVGADLLRQWNLPSVITDAVDAHHRPEESESVLASLLFLAEEWSGAQPAGAPEETLALEMRRLWAEKRAGIKLDAFAELSPDAEWLSVAC